MEDNHTLKNLKIEYQKLIDLGFIKIDGVYLFQTEIMHHQFSLSIQVNQENKIISDVIDLSTHEKYVPYYTENANGNFIGQMRKEYQCILDKVKKCSSKNVFKSEYANLVIAYIKNKYNDDLEYLWDKFPEYAVFRNQENKKWYAILLIVEKRKIGIDEDGKIEIIDLRMHLEKLSEIVDNKKYFHGYHMNKKHWFTMKLDGSVAIEEIYKWMDESYAISKNK